MVSLDPSFVRNILAALAAGPLFYVCTDERFAAKLPRIFAGFPGMVRPVLLGRDCLAGIPAGSTVYAMPRAVERRPVPEGAPCWVCPPRVLSPETRRALLGFIVEANLASPAG